MKKEPGWQLIAPGVYIDQQKHAHLCVREVLVHYGMEYNRENYNLVRESFIKIVAEIFPDGNFSIVEVPDK